MPNEKTVIETNHRKQDVSVTPGRRYMMNHIVVDMTGWDNGSHGDQLPDPSTRVMPYLMQFQDDRGTVQEFRTRNVKSNAMHDMLDSLGREFNVHPDPYTKVTVICPQDCLGNYWKEDAVQYACTETTTIKEFARKGMGALSFGITNRGLARKRLESVLDDMTHECVRQSLQEPLHRQVPFENSVYKRFDADRRFVQVLQEELANKPTDAMGRPIGGWLPWGGNPPLEV